MISCSALLQSGRPAGLPTGKRRERAGQLWPSEVMTILIHFHQSHYRTFKAYYTEQVQVHLNKEFPHLVSYTRFVALIPGMLIPLLAYLQGRFGLAPGSVLSIPPPWKFVIPNGSISIGSLLLMPGVGRRAWAGSLAGRLHLAVNDRGDLLACCLTAGNVDDRKPVPQMVKRLRGKLIGDRGYVSAPLTVLLFEQGLQLLTRLRKNMTNRLMHLSDKLLLRKRAIIESIIDQLKNISQIEHSRHRSPTNLVVVIGVACWR